jgi:beta-glucosidase
MALHRFPAGFLWGVATSAAQIEGGAREDGRGDSIWDAFARERGRIADGSNPAIACDHYHRWREDVDLMRWLGVGAYRFSISWPRVIPAGRGAVNAAGLDFYDRLVDALLHAGIRPFVTLYHWDLPQALQSSGGWSARATVDAFVEYADLVAKRLGDRVSHWATHNEPWCVAHLGHETGEQAPGHRDPAEALRAAHHVLLSHGRAVPVLRHHSRGEVGIVLNLSPAWPATPKAADVEAARRFDGAFNRWYLDPLFRRRYPASAIADRVRRGHLPDNAMTFVHDGDMDQIAAPIDFLGINYYSRTVLRAGADGEPMAVDVVPGNELTDMGWEVHPRSLYDLLLRVSRDYHPPRVYITENGAAYADEPDATGQVADRRRVEYLHGHMLAAHEALAAGVPLRGYFVWSLLDNFEWAHGYERRFGLCWVDFATGRRLPKESAFWYRDLVAANAIGDSVQHDALRRLP